MNVARVDKRNTGCNSLTEVYDDSENVRKVERRKSWPEVSDLRAVTLFRPDAECQNVTTLCSS